MSGASRVRRSLLTAHQQHYSLLVVIAAFFLAAFTFLLLAAAFALVLALVLFAASGILLAGAVAFAGFLMAGAVLRAGAVLTVGCEADAVRACHLAVIHARLFCLLHSGASGVGVGAVITIGVAVAGNHCESKSDSEESRD